MDNWVLGFIGIALLVAVVATAYVVGRRKAAGEPLQWEDLGQVIRMAQGALGNIFTEAEVEATARFIYRRWNMASDLYSEEQWVTLMKSIFPAGKTRAASNWPLGPADAAAMQRMIDDMRA